MRNKIQISKANQIGFMIAWGTTIIENRKNITIEIPFITIQIFLN